MSQETPEVEPSLPLQEDTRAAEPLPDRGPSLGVADDLPALPDGMDETGGAGFEAAPVVPPSDDSGSTVVEAVQALADRLDRRLDALQNTFERELRAEATREKVIDRLHAELQEYKQDLLLNTLRPVFIDLIQLHDDIGKVAVVPADGAEGEAGRLLGLMAGFQQGIEDILYRQGVEPFEAEGDAFDPRRQRAVSTVATDDPGRNKTVAARLRKGFRAGDRVIRAEIVSVYAFKKAP